MSDVKEELAQITEAMERVQALHGMMSAEQVANMLAPLQQKLAELEARLAAADHTANVSGSGASAQGEKATAVGQQGVNVQNSTTGPIHTGPTFVLPPVDGRPARTAQRYLKGFIRACDTLPLEQMGGTDGVGKAIGLDQVYVALDTRRRVPLAAEGDADEQRPRSPEEKERPLTALEAATQQRQLVLLGKPGSGKSTFLKQLAAWLARAWLGLAEPPPGWQPHFPLLVSLRDLSHRLAALTLSGDEREQRQQLLAAARAQWQAELARYEAEDTAQELLDWLQDGRVLLLFDGLDEVGVAQRPRIRQAISAVRAAYDLPILVTCRINSYTGTAVLSGFATETLDDFDEAKIRAFVAAWYDAHVHLGRLSPQEAAEKTKDLQQAATRDLGELAANPMLLTVMALIHRENVGLPKQRVKLYSRAVQILLTRWQKQKGLALSAELAALLEDERRIRPILELLAYEAHKLQEKAGSGASLTRKEMIAILEQPHHLGSLGLTGEFLEYIDQRAGLLVGEGGGEPGQPPAAYNFPHRSFQEYLAGCYMVSGRFPDRNFWPHMDSSDYWYLAAELGSEELLYNNPQGQTLFLNLAYALCPESAPRRAAEWRGVVWSGRMATLLTATEIADDDAQPGGGLAYLSRLRPRLEAALSVALLERGERAAAGRSLARLGDDRAEVMTVDGMRFAYVPPGPFLMGSADDDPQAQDNEKPQHELDIAYGYWLAEYPVSNAQFQEFVDAGGYQNADFWPEAIRDGYWQAGYFQGGWDDEKRERPYDFGEPFTLPNHPVVGLSWYEAVAFARWLTTHWQHLLPPKWAIHLPSEAEWEKGARGGLALPSLQPLQPVAQMTAWEPALSLAVNPLSGRLYPWGNVSPDPNSANHVRSGINATSALGCFPANITPYGLREMAGNVWEWTRSRDKKYPYDPFDGREQVQSGTDWVCLRGGSWRNDGDGLRLAARFGINPSSGYDYFGFRVAASPFTSGL